MKQFQHELIGPDLVERHHRRMPERRIGLVGHAAEIGVGDIAGDKRLDDLDRDFPIRPAEKARDGFSDQAAARPRAHRDRRHGRARSASHRRNRVSGPRPGSKDSASSRPPKAAHAAKPLILNELYFHLRVKIDAHHKAFWREGETGMAIKCGASGADTTPQASRNAAMASDAVTMRANSPLRLASVMA